MPHFIVIWALEKRSRAAVCHLPCKLAHQERLARLEGLVDAVVEVFALVGTDGVLRHVERVEHLAYE